MHVCMRICTNLNPYQTQTLQLLPFDRARPGYVLWPLQVKWDPHQELTIVRLDSAGLRGLALGEHRRVTAGTGRWPPEGSTQSAAHRAKHGKGPLVGNKFVCYDSGPGGQGDAGSGQAQECQGADWKRPDPTSGADRAPDAIAGPSL